MIQIRGRILAKSFCGLEKNKRKQSFKQVLHFRKSDRQTLATNYSTIIQFIFSKTIHAQG